MRRSFFLVGGLAALLVAALLAVGGQLVGADKATSMDQAQQAAQAYLDRTGSPNLKIDELIEFDQNFYARIQERDTGVGAFELLINRATGVVSREPGPDMMWNTKYSPMAGGMMGRYYNSGPMAVSAQQAQAIAQSWLDANAAGSTAEAPDVFYGFYTVDYSRAGKLAGMLSVNGYSGQVWYHSWHGGFVQSHQVA